MRLWPGLCPEPHWGSSQHSWDLIAELGGRAGGEGRGREGNGVEGKGEEGNGRKRREWKNRQTKKSGYSIECVHTKLQSVINKNDKNYHNSCYQFNSSNFGLLNSRFVKLSNTISSFSTFTGCGPSLAAIHIFNLIHICCMPLPFQVPTRVFKEHRSHHKTSGTATEPKCKLMLAKSTKSAHKNWSWLLQYFFELLCKQ